MSFLKDHLELKPDTLSIENLSKLKWCTTVAVIGIPVLIQLLGAMIFLQSEHPILMSTPFLVLYALVAMIVATCGIFALTNRVFLRFSVGNPCLQEWESKTRSDAFAFSYRMIAKGVLVLFAGISLLGALQAFNVMGWINFNFGRSFVFNIKAIAALSVAVTYLTLLLPTLYIAWTLRPLNADDSELS